MCVPAQRTQRTLTGLFGLCWVSLILRCSSFIHKGIKPRQSIKARQTLMMATIDQDTSYLQWLARQLELKTRPQPYQSVRLRLEKDFAVLLMRTSYTVADALDFVPMDKFQENFFRFRQSEWEDYYTFYPTGFMRQGELTDPNYFDFISFAQYATIDSGMREGKLVFVEKINADGEKQVVRRDPAMEDNGLLPAEHARLVGDTILERFLETPLSFAPAMVGPSASVQDVVLNFQRMVDIMRAQRYCISGAVSSSKGVGAGGRPQIQVQLDSPANLWSLQMLRYRKARLLNDFEVKVLMAWLRANSLVPPDTDSAAIVRTEVVNDGNSILHTFTL